MRSAINNANKCFKENLDRFAQPVEQHTEKYNLYQGLANLAEAIGELDEKLSAIQQELRQLGVKV